MGQHVESAECLVFVSDRYARSPRSDSSAAAKWLNESDNVALQKLPSFIDADDLDGDAFRCRLTVQCWRYFVT